MPRLIDDGTGDAGGWGWIVGIHGAGVSLLEGLLAQHPQLKVCSRGVMLGYLDLIKRKLVQVDDFWSVNNLQIVETYVDRGALALRLGVEELPLGWPTTLVREWFEALRSRMRTAVGEVPALVLEGACRYRSQMTDVQAVFPRSHIVWVKRDPWDVVWSTARHKTGLGLLPHLSQEELVVQELGILCQQARFLRDHVETYGDLVKTIDFASMLADPEAVKPLVAALGLDVDGWTPLHVGQAREDEPATARDCEATATIRALREQLLDRSRLGLPWLTHDDVDAFFEAFPSEGDGW